MYVEQRIRDPIHNLISFEANEFEDVIWRTIQTRPFQRLRRVRQLGFSDLVYPGATHSRFAHSVGVFHTARQLMAIIRRNVGSENWSDYKAYAALAAALVHDVGHGPFSHAFEEVGRRLDLKLAHHEHVSDLLIRDSEISHELRSIGSGFHTDVAAVIASKGPRSVYDAVVSSQFDADRLDYMRRDRFMAGSSHGVIDYEWLISNLQVDNISTGVDDQKVSEIKTFVIGPKGIFAAEAYVLGLFQLYPTIYFHKATRGVEAVFTELLVRVFQLISDGAIEKTGLVAGHPLARFAKDPSSLDVVQCLDDTVIYGALSLFCDASDVMISEFAKRIRDRNLLKCFDLRSAVMKSVHEKARKVDGDRPSSSELEKSVSRITLAVADKVDVLKKASKNRIILKDEVSRAPYKRFEESKGPLNQIMVRGADGSLTDLAEYSPVVGAIPTFEVFRYYYDREDEKFEKEVNEMIKKEMKNGV